MKNEAKIKLCQCYTTLHYSILVHHLQCIVSSIQYNHLIPAITGRPPYSQIERDLLALPVRLSGLGIINPVSSAQSSFETSSNLTAPLVAAIATKDLNHHLSRPATKEIKTSIHKNNREKQKHTAEHVYNQSTKALCRSAKERGSSSWLSVLPLDDHGFALHKGDFQDALCLRYGWSLLHTPAKCNCGSSFSVDHAMVCPMGSFPTIRHNELIDFTASLLTEVCHNVATEPHLQPLNGESMSLHSAITIDNAQVDIRANGFWTGSQDAYFDIRVFHPNAPSNAGSISSAFKKHEDVEKRAYGQHIRQIEHGVFTPLVFLSTGGIGREATIFYKRIVDLLGDKPYPVIMG